MKSKMTWLLIFTIESGRCFSFQDFRDAVKDARSLPRPTESDWNEVKSYFAKSDRNESFRVLWGEMLQQKSTRPSISLEQNSFCRMRSTGIPTSAHDQVYRYIVDSQRNRVIQFMRNMSTNESAFAVELNQMRWRGEIIQRAIANADKCNTMSLPDKNYWEVVRKGVASILRSDSSAQNVSNLCGNMAKLLTSVSAPNVELKEIFLYLITSKVERPPVRELLPGRSEKLSGQRLRALLELEMKATVGNFSALVQEYQKFFDPYLRQFTLLLGSVICIEYDVARKKHEPAFQAIYETFLREIRTFRDTCFSGGSTSNVTSRFRYALEKYAQDYAQAMRAFYDTVDKERHGTVSTKEAIDLQGYNLIDGCFRSDGVIAVKDSSTTYQCGQECGHTTNCLAWTYFEKEMKCELHHFSLANRPRSSGKEIVKGSFGEIWHPLERCESYLCGNPCGKWKRYVGAYLPGWTRNGSACFSEKEARHRCMLLNLQTPGSCGGINQQRNECGKQWTVRLGTTPKMQPPDIRTGAVAEILTMSCASGARLRRHAGAYLPGWTSDGSTCYDKHAAVEKCFSLNRLREGSCGGINQQRNECSGKQWTVRQGATPKIQPSAIRIGAVAEVFTMSCHLD